MQRAAQSARKSLYVAYSIAPQNFMCYCRPDSRMGSPFKSSSSVAGKAVLQPVVPILRGAELAVAHIGDSNRESLYDFVRVSRNRVLFAFLGIADRAQEGAIVSAAQGTFRARASEVFVSDEVNEAEAMIELCIHLNRSILNAAGGVHSSPAFAGCYNEDLGTVCYFNAGHKPTLMRDSTSLSELGPTGLPLGLFSHVTCDARIVALQPGAVLALVSGEVLEQRGKDGDESSLGPLMKSLQQVQADSADKVCQAILGSIQVTIERSKANLGALALLRSG